MPAQLTPSDLDQIRYLPAIRTRQAELYGYRQLRQTTKSALTPLLSLGKLGREEDPSKILAQASAEVGGKYFVDLNPFSGQMCAGFETICKPDNAYEAWRNLVATQPNAIPVALVGEGPTERPFIQQVRRLERDFGVAVIRTRRPLQELPILQAALSAVDDVNNMLIILDFGYIRGSLEVREAECLQIITALRLVDPAIRIVTMASSFPKSVAAYGDSKHPLEILERDLHWHLGGDQVAIYGDHSSIFPLPSEPTMSRWVPRVDYCLPNHWVFRRYRSEDGGFVRCAQEIVALPDWDPLFAEQVWGAGIIRRTAETGQDQKSFGSPRNWIAARVNMHIERQHTLSFAAPGESDDEDDDFDQMFS